MKIDKKNISAIYLQLDVEDQKSLYLMLAKDGTINRLGNGTVDNDQHEMFKGQTDEKLFESFMFEVDDELFQYAGSYQDSEAVGTPCKLTMLFQYGDGEESTGFEFKYGTDTQGPPTEICDLVVTGIDLTDPWFEHQIALAESAAEKSANS